MRGEHRVHMEQDISNVCAALSSQRGDEVDTDILARSIAHLSIIPVRRLLGIDTTGARPHGCRTDDEGHHFPKGGPRLQEPPAPCRLPSSCLTSEWDGWEKACCAWGVRYPRVPMHRGGVTFTIIKRKRKHGKS